MQVNIGQGALPTAVLIGKADMVKVDAAVGYFRDGVFRIVEVRRSPWSTSPIRRTLAMDMVIMTTTMESIISDIITDMI